MAVKKKNEEKAKDGNEEGEGVRIYPDCPADLWSKIHNIPIKHHVCVECDKLMFTDRPFLFKSEVNSPTTWVGLTTEKNGKHACTNPDAELSIAKIIFDDTGESVFERLFKDAMKKVRAAGGEEGEEEGSGGGGGGNTAR
jgi:hypothetical protein